MTPTGVLKLNSDTNHLELDQTTQVKGLVLHKTVPALDGATSGVSRPPVLLTGWLQIWGSHQPVQFNNSLEQLTKISKHCTYDYSFVIKDTDQVQPDE